MSEHLDSRAGRLAAALDDFLGASPDVEAAAVVSFDGLPMASALPDHLEEDRVGAMSAALLSLGEQAAMGLGRGRLNQVFVEGEHGFVFLMSCRDQAVLAAVAARPAKIGFMLFEMRRAAETIGHLLASDEAPAAEVANGEAPRLSAVPTAPTWTHPSTYDDRDDDAVQQAVDAFAAPAWDAPTDDTDSEPAWAQAYDEPSAALGELRSVSAEAPTSPTPSTPPPIQPPSLYAPADAADPADDEADLLAVLATEPLDRADDHDLLTEALFEVRRATGGDTAQVPSWARPDTSTNGWG